MLTLIKIPIIIAALLMLPCYAQDKKGNPMVSKTDYNSKVSFPINKGDILPDYAMNYYGINRVNKPDLSDSVMRVKFVDLFSGYLDSYVNQCDTVGKNE